MALGAGPILVCSHRGPVTYRRAGRRLIPKSVGPGGLVPVMTPVLKHFGGRWMFAPSSDDDRAVARADPAGRARNGFVIQIVDVPNSVHRRHYQVVSVECLGRLFHYLFELAYAPSFDARFGAAWNDYRKVNELYADAVLRAPGDDPVFIEDYHLMLVARGIRRQRPGFARPLLYFHHVPWCAADYFGLLPKPLRAEILAGLLCHDTLGFHTQRWSKAFLDCCDRFLPGARVGEASVEWNGRLVRVVAAPAPIDVDGVARAAHSARVDWWVERMNRRVAGRWAIVRVDRVDLWKNALRGLQAFAAVLDRRPALASEVCFLAVLTSTRTWVAEYRSYLRACERAAARINARFGDSGSLRAPVELLVAGDPRLPDHDRALGGMRVADAVLVNPLFDGLNLVAKESVVVSERDAVLILSENAGAYDDLAAGALGINPFDVGQTADAIERALDMPPDERRERADILRRAVRSRTPASWVQAQLLAATAD